MIKIIKVSILTSACALGLALPVPAADSSSKTTQGSAAQTQREKNAKRASLGRIAENPQNYDGKTVRVTAEAGQVMGRNVIALDEDEWSAGPDVLVLLPKNQQQPQQGSKLTITGTVRTYNQAEFDRDYDWFDKNAVEQLRVDWSQRPVIIASSVRSSQGEEFVESTTTREQTRQQYSQTRGSREQSRRSSTAQDQQSKRAFVVSAGDIAEDPERFYGKKVQVRAEVEDVHGNTVFTLDEERLFAGPDVLVVAPGGSVAPRDGNMATVTGTVRQFVSRDIYRDYDWYGYGWYGYNWGYYNDVWADWDRRPVIIADSIVSENGRELVAQQETGRPSGQSRLDRKIYLASPGEIAARANDYYSRHVSVRSEIAERFNPHAFTLDEDRLLVTNDLLVIIPRPAANALEGSTVRVIGVVQPFDRESFQRDYDWFDVGLFQDQDLEELEEWEESGRPVIIARSIRTENGQELVQAPRSRQEAMGGTAEDTQQYRGEQTR